LNYRNFNKAFLCNIQSLETWNLRDRDSQKWVSRQVSRSRPSLETPSLRASVSPGTGTHQQTSSSMYTERLLSCHTRTDSCWKTWRVQL